ncbi:MAG: C25 family cysteine peptidase [candidate division Zixibacteria bacterium]|nr:C25 family cysteine peptidase [candidate division Zixibacteria bacterium]
MAVTGERYVNGLRCAELLLFPVTVDWSGHLWFHPSVQVSVSGRVIPENDFIPPVDEERSVRDESVNSQGPDYLVVTSASLADALQPLVAYKNETGYRTELHLIEDILPQQPGRDDAEKLREYLKQFYAEGGRYVLLAGDETVLPIRHAYPNSASSLPALDQLQVCDLYFADLTGDWDADGDGVWGEKYTDAVDVNPELLVGRLPINTPEEAANYVSKLIRYETDPGEGERSYLQQAFFFSSDQMRDYGEHGQHGAIAEAYPDWFEIDTVSGVEQANGADPAPTNPNLIDLAPILNQGFGIVNIIAHGRSDGFVLKSAYYNEWPKTYLLSNGDGSDHGVLTDLMPYEKPAFVYSLACNNGGFDMDQPPLGQADISLVQQLIGSPVGAVGMVAYSRWGWISVSYILQQAFFDSLFAHPDRPAVEALYASKAVFYYYRDLVYGLNFYGDPTLRVYTRVPAKPGVVTNLKDHGLEVAVSVDGQVAEECRLLLTENGQMLDEYATDLNGRVTIAFPFEKTSRYRLSALIQGDAVTQVDYIPSLVTDVDEDTVSMLPVQFALHQNYPNPFNPSTNIAFDLPVHSDVSLRVYNLLGQQIAQLIDGSIEAGFHSLTWNGTTASGEPAGSGVYFYRLESGNATFTKKMILLK